MQQFVQLLILEDTGLPGSGFFSINQKTPFSVPCSSDFQGSLLGSGLHTSN